MPTSLNWTLRSLICCYLNWPNHVQDYLHRSQLRCEHTDVEMDGCIRSVPNSSNLTITICIEFLADCRISLGQPKTLQEPSSTAHIPQYSTDRCGNSTNPSGSTQRILHHARWAGTLQPLENVVVWSVFGVLRSRLITLWKWVRLRPGQLTENPSAEAVTFRSPHRRDSNT